MQAAAVGVAAKQDRHLWLWLLGSGAILSSALLVVLTAILAMYANSPDLQQHMANLSTGQRQIVQRGYQVYFVAHLGALATLALAYGVLCIVTARGAAQRVYSGVPMLERLAWDANGWLWLLLIIGFSSLGFSRDWYIQLAELVLMLGLAAACFVRGTCVVRPSASRHVWARGVALGLIAWVIVEWVGLAFTPAAVDEVRQAFDSANETFWLTADRANMSTVVGTLPWLVVAAVYLLASDARGSLAAYFDGGGAYPALVRRFGDGVNRLVGTLEPALLYVTILATWAGNVWTLIPVWLLLLVPAFGVRHALASHTGDTVAANTERRDALVRTTRWPLLLLSGVAATIIGNWVIRLAAPADATPSTADMLRANLPAAASLTVAAFGVIALHYAFFAMWPYHAGQSRWKADQLVQRRTAFDLAEADLGSAVAVPLDAARFSQTAVAYVDLLRRQSRYSLAQARVTQLKEIPLWPIKSTSGLIAALTRGSVLSAALSQLSALAGGGHPATAGGGEPAGSVVPQLLKLLAEVLGKAGS